MGEGMERVGLGLRGGRALRIGARMSGMGWDGMTATQPLWTSVCGLLSVDCCLWTSVCGLLSVDFCLWTSVCGHLSVDICLWTAACGLLSVHTGSVTR